MHLHQFPRPHKPATLEVLNRSVPYCPYFTSWVHEDFCMGLFPAIGIMVRACCAESLVQLINDIQDRIALAYHVKLN